MLFGDLQIGPQTVLALDLHAPDNGFPQELDGILGYDFLSRFPVTIDYVGGWLTFWKPGSYRPLPEEIAVPGEFSGTLIRVPVRINGEDAGLFDLDIGNGRLCAVQHVTLSRALVAQKERGILYPHGQEYGTGSASAYLTHADLTVGRGAQAVTWRSAPVYALNLDDPKAAGVAGQGNLGNAWLRHFRIRFDYAASTIYLLQRRSFRPSSLSGDYGIDLRPANGKIIARDVAEHTPAAAAGLKPGDELVDVDGVPAVLVDNLVPRLLADSIPGERHVARFRRGKEVFTAQLTAAPIP
jgi:PDZ domain